MEVKVGMKVALFAPAAWNEEPEIKDVLEIKSVWKSGVLVTEKFSWKHGCQFTFSNKRDGRVHIYGRGENFNNGIVIPEGEEDQYQALAEQYKDKRAAERAAKVKAEEERQQRYRNEREQAIELCFTEVDYTDAVVTPLGSHKVFSRSVTHKNPNRFYQHINRATAFVSVTVVPYEDLKYSSETGDYVTVQLWHLYVSGIMETEFDDGRKVRHHTFDRDYREVLPGTNYWPTVIYDVMRNMY